MLRGGLVGLGNVARSGHLPAWSGRSDVEIVAAADIASESRAAITDVAPAFTVYDSADALIAEERLDFIDVCTPPSSHAGVIRLALNRGLHVLCEKPLVLAQAELDELAALARRRDRVLAAVHNWRHAPAIRLATELVLSGRVGTVRRCVWEVLRERPSAAAPRPGAPNWRLDPTVSGGGILVDHGWHAAYILAGWMAQPLSRAGGRLEIRRHRDWPVEDTADLHLEFGNARADVFLTWAASERKNRVSIEGTNGAIRIEGRLLALEAGGKTERRELSGSLSDGSHHPEWFAGTIAEFLSEIADRTVRGRSLEESAVCLEVIRLAQASERQGGAMLAVGEIPAALREEASAAAGASEGRAR